MEKLHTIQFSGYRSFATKTTLELRPLTLIYGRNNAGKSALLRLLPILADSVSERAEAPLDLSGPAGRGASFLDILWRGQIPASRKLTLELHWSDESKTKTTIDTYTLDYSDKIGTYVRSYKKSTLGIEKTEFEADAVAFGEDNKYTIKDESGQPQEAEVNFIGLIPTSTTKFSTFHDLTERLRTLRHHVQWLESIRTGPDRIVRKTGGTPRTLSPNGRRAAEAILASPYILNELQTWYSGSETRRRLEISDVSGSMRRIFLNPSEGSCRDIDIADTGEGMVQVFPVLVATAMARKEGSAAFLAVEEPESHLHANAQKALATYFSSIASESDAPTIVIETHSRMLMLGVQLAIASGALPPNKACAYWVDQEEDGRSVVTKIEFDKAGGLINWPASAFSEDQKLARELLALQLAAKE
ncbi:hypothetical protein D7V77_01750 [Corallococcus sp. CA041A]|uniref:AAA family ATPase n=1 Tax=Corallococcus sp. CA041A TaxID=2316727 RepID=UPI000EA28158|nr:AAA family ATPase [Corallococcus sp. CA041A]RKH30767.1 hypothetical protein D7V77_01750 [Corallococcus sp. CA041A]